MEEQWELSASSNVNPSTARILLVNVLNPLQATSIKNMRLGTAVITLPLSSNDKGQHKHFLVSKDVPPGYYLLNLITKFPNQNINLVYTGKAFCTSTNTASSNKNTYYNTQ